MNKQEVGLNLSQKIDQEITLEFSSNFRYL